MEIRFIPLIVLFVINGCKNDLRKYIVKNENGTVSHYFIDQDSLKQGKAFTYYPSGRILSKALYKDNEHIDTIYHFTDGDLQKLKAVRYIENDGFLFYKDFYKNGNIRQVGFYNLSDQRIGKWKNYKENGDLHFIKEYKIIKGKSWTNQVWEFLSTGDTLNIGTSMRYQVSDTVVKLGDSIKFKFAPEVMQYPNGGSDFVVIIPKNFQKENFNHDFSNENENPDENKFLKRVYSLKYQEGFEKEKKAIDSSAWYKTVIFYIKPTQVGRDTLRGYFNEIKSLDPDIPNLPQRGYKKDTLNKEGTYTLENRQIYFDIPIEVIE